MLKRFIRILVPALALMLAESPLQTALANCPNPSPSSGLQSLPCTGQESARPAVIPSGHHLMWAVTGPRGSGYLLGALHFGKPEMFPLPAEIIHAYHSSQTLVVETNISAVTPAQVARMVAAKAVYRDGTTLPRVLAPATWQRLQLEMKKLGESPQSIQAVKRQKPWLVSLSLTSLALKRFGFDEDLGIDRHFMALANKEGKPIVQLETFEQQLNFLDGFSAADQEKMLEDTFDDLEKGRDFLSNTLEAWRTGDAHRIDQLLNEDFRTSSETDQRMYKVLITDRNAAMADKLDRLFHRGGKYFVVLGAAHFVGDDGIVALLKAKGYRVQQD